PMDLREIAPAAHRETVKITSLDVVLACLFERSALLEQPSQPEVGLGKARLPVEEGSITCLAVRRVVLLGRPGLLELLGELSALGLRDTSGEDGPVGLEAGFAGGGNDQDRNSADLLAVGDDRLEPAAKIREDLE